MIRKTLLALLCLPFLAAPGQAAPEQPLVCLKNDSANIVSLDVRVHQPGFDWAPRQRLTVPGAGHACRRVVGGDLMMLEVSTAVLRGRAHGCTWPAQPAASVQVKVKQHLPHGIACSQG